MKRNRQLCLLFKLLISYLFLMVAFYFIGGDQLKYKYVVSPLGSQDGILEEFTKDIEIRQPFVPTEKSLETIDILFCTYARENTGTITVKIIDETGTEMARQFIDVSALKDNNAHKWVISPGIPDVEGKSLTLILTSDCMPGTSPSIYYSVPTDNQQTFYVNGTVRNGRLCFDFVGKRVFFFGTYYWQFMGGFGVLMAAYFLWAMYREAKGKPTVLSHISAVWSRYQFLIRQLVSRDFKTKYKRSILGYLWSFLNPLLTMTVQYIVFSTIFKSTINNFPVYLLSGIILFNFFTESVGQGLTAIVGNASLITKVYVPKYIYPVTKVISCSINLVISVIPLLLVTIITGTRITTAILCLPYVFICLLLFCIGMALFLSTTMVFFRDTEYLWGIASLIWTYATPLFYPENIIPAQFRFVQTLNPLYHYIRFTRTILINGVVPEPRAFAICLLSALLTCAAGTAVFKRFQDRFVLYI